MLKVISANLNGVRSAATKGFFPWLINQQADFICVQELKAQSDNLTPTMRQPEGLTGYFHFAEKKGYSGVGIYTRHTPVAIIEGLRIPEIDAEGRYLELVYPNLSVISVYLPSGSSGEHRQTAKFAFMAHFYHHLVQLAQQQRQFIVCGDWNIAHQEMDLKNWKGNQKNSGFLPEERAWMTSVLSSGQWVDVYRHLYPHATDEGYTWWSNRGQARAKNVGWRIDYQIASPNIAHSAQQASIYKQEWFSDHAPLIIDYDWVLSD